MTKVFNFPYEGTPLFYKNSWEQEVENMAIYRANLTPEEREIYEEFLEHFRTRNKRAPKCYKSVIYRDFLDLTDLSENDIHEYMKNPFDIFIQFHALIRYKDEIRYVKHKK